MNEGAMRTNICTSLFATELCEKTLSAVHQHRAVLLLVFCSQKMTVMPLYRRLHSRTEQLPFRYSYIKWS
jgi:hypothetical protein